MRFVHRTDEGVIDVNYMWMPTFIGMNAQLKAELEQKLNEQFANQALSDGVLDEMHDTIIELLMQKFTFAPGLRDYLEAVKHVNDEA